MPGFIRSRLRGTPVEGTPRRWPAVLAVLLLAGGLAGVIALIWHLTS